MRRFIYVIVITGIVAVLAPIALGAPLMQLSEKEFDFGYAPQNSKISHVFWVYNRGDDTLKIEKVVPG